MTTNDGYTIIQYPTENAIVITLPQRLDTLTNTFTPVSDRRKSLSDTEEVALLTAVKAMFENRAKMDDNDSPLPVNKDRSLCKLRHKNGNCLCIGGFCTAVNDEICKSIRMSYEKGYVDGKTDGVRHGRWVNLKISASGNSSAECSLCGAVVHNNFSNIINYCPNCGASMKGDTE